MAVEPTEMVIALIVTFGAAVVQGSIGMGFNILSVPILALVDPLLAPVPQLVVSLPLTLATARRERHEIDLKGLWWILAGRVPGALIGLGLLAIATTRVLDLLVAAFVLAAVAVLATGTVIARSAGIDFVAGVFAGTTGLVASMGGPPLALLFARERGPRLRATLAVVFSVGLALSLVARTAAGEITLDEVAIGAILIAPGAAGFALSGRLLARVEGTTIRVGVLLLSTTAAFALAVRAVTG